MARFESVAGQLNAHRDSLLQYSVLWRESGKEALGRFLEGKEGGTEPPLQHFRTQVTRVVNCR